MTTWETIDKALSYLGIPFGAPTSGQTIGGSHDPNSEHYQGRARDYGNATSDPGAIAQALLPYAQGQGAPIDELFYAPLGIFYKNGSPITPSDALRQEHYDHVHVGIGPGVDLAAVVESKGPAGAATPTSLGSAVSGAWSALTDPVGSVRKIVLTGLFVAGGVALVAAGGLRAVKR